MIFMFVRCKKKKKGRLHVNRKDTDSDLSDSPNYLSFSRLHIDLITISYAIAPEMGLYGKDEHM